MRIQSNTQLSAENSLDMRPPHTTKRNWVRKSHTAQEIGRRAERSSADLMYLLSRLHTHTHTHTPTHPHTHTHTKCMHNNNKKGNEGNGSWQELIYQKIAHNQSQKILNK